ncbi:golgin subfamily B member 1 [Trichomycterus rosablanca]|uniref:golgin subfamily B member 1 n=1 Tax=Trichomycterus rosablanca TaxID=2290929 RepID=UPI002F359DFD
MFSRLTQGVNSVLQELSGEEHHDDDPQDGLVPKLPPGADASFEGPGPSEEILERLAHTEQLVVELKELIREKDEQLADSERRHKEEREQGEAKFTKLKLQAKAKMAALNKQITEMKGQEGLNTSQSSDSSFTAPAGLEEELQQLKQKLIREEAATRTLQEQLQEAERRLNEREEDHAEQVRVLQAVVKDKDVRFQEQIQKHEEELLHLTTQNPNDVDLQQALRESQRRCEELEESLRSRSEVLEMLQQELNSADQQKQILTTQFRQMEQELAQTQRLREEERQQWTIQTQEQLQSLRASLENEREEAMTNLQAELTQRSSELDQARAKLEEISGRETEADANAEAELARLRSGLGDSEIRCEELRKELELQVENRAAELHRVENEKEEQSRGEREEMTRLQTELREEQEAGTRAKRALEKLWTGIRSLTGGDEGRDEDVMVPDDPAQMLLLLEARMENPREGRMSQVDLAIEDLQAQLNKSAAEREEAVSRVEQLQQQLAEVQVAAESQGGQGTEPPQRDLDGADEDAASLSEKVSALEQQLLEREKELSALTEKLASTEQQNLQTLKEGSAEWEMTKNIPKPDSPEALAGLEDTLEEDTTLTAVESSAMSTSVLSNESYSEITGAQAESPVELKAASSDEMVTSTDSEVAHSSWTLLEAINQEPSPEWPSQIQNFGTLQISTQSWEETSEEQVTSSCSAVEVESSSVVIRETVQVQISQKEANLLNMDSTSGQDFAQILAEELQKRYSEILNELQQLRKVASESQEKVHLLEEELKSLTLVRDEAEARAQRSEQDLMDARAQLQKEAEEQTTETDSQIDVKKFLEEQVESLNLEALSKDEKIQALQGDLDEIQSKHLLEEELKSLMLVRDEAEARAQRSEQDLMDARAQLQKEAEEQTTETDSQIDVKKFLEEQVESLKLEALSKDEKIQALQGDLDEIQSKHLLEEELKSLMLVRDEAEARAQRSEQDLMDARAQLQKEAEEQTTETDSQIDVKKFLEEQVESLKLEALSKDEKIQALQGDLDEIQSKHLLEEELKSLMLVRDEAEARAQRSEQDLMDARAQLQKEAEEQTTETDSQIDVKKFLEEQVESLKLEALSKDEKVQALQGDLDEIQSKLFEKEGQVRMLGVQLEDRELAFSEVEEKLTQMEDRIQQSSHEADMAKSALVDRTSELEDLQHCLSLKEQEMLELNDTMTSKLLQAGEEKFALSNEVRNLKDQMQEMEKTWENQHMETLKKPSNESEELVTLRKENENLTAQIATMKTDGELVKRKLQAALVQRKELIKKVAELEKATGGKEREDVALCSAQDNNEELQKLEEQLRETRQILSSKEEALTVIEQKALSQDQALAEAHAEIQQLMERSKVDEERVKLHSQITTLETELDALQKKFQEAVDSRKDTLRKAKEKDRHHREQLRQHKEEYSDLLKRLEAEDEGKAKLLKRLQDLECLVESKEQADKERLVHVQEEVKTTLENVEKQGSGDWVQEDWDDFAGPDAKTNQQSATPDQPSQAISEDNKAVISFLQEQVKAEQSARMDLEEHLEQSKAAVLLKDTEMLELRKELETLRAKERQIDALSEELDTLREKCKQAESHAELLKAEVEEAAATARASISVAESPVAALQAEVEEFKQFLQNKNDEIIDLSQQLNEQGVLLIKMQETVLEKDNLIASLQEGLKTEQERSQKMEAEIGQRQDEEKDDNTAKVQQLQRKFQAALVSRKEALRENQTLKQELAAVEKVQLELLTKIENVEAERSKLVAEKEKLIEEVDRTLLENQSLGAACESLKLAMDGLLSEKDACQRQIESSKEDAEQAARRWEEKLQGMKEEYETLLKSYENVSDEAERVRKVLEAARQERQESAAKARAHEAAKQEAERLAEEAQKEVDVVKDKMRKFAKSKQQKILELEEENENLREQVERKGNKEPDTGLKHELEQTKSDLEALKADLINVETERSSLEQETKNLKLQLDQETSKKNTGFSEEVIKEEVVAQQSSLVLSENQEVLVGRASQELLDQRQDSEEPLLKQETTDVKTEIVLSAEAEKRLRKKEATLQTAEINIKSLQPALEEEKKTRVELGLNLNAELVSLKQQLQESMEKEKTLTEECLKRETQLQELRANLEDTNETSVSQEALLGAELTSLKQQLQESVKKEEMLKEECSTKEAQLQELRTRLEMEKDDLEERLMNQLAQVNGSIAGYQQEAADCRDRLVDLQRELEKMEREQAESEAMLVSERARAARLEEDKRQAQRERAEAETEAGKQRELEQKLKSAQRVKDSSQSRARQLEELLREKQLEVRQMQKDCIQYQERISELDRQAKALSLGKDEASSELKVAHQEIKKITEERTRLESELSTFKENLSVAQGEASQALQDKKATEERSRKLEAELKSEAERTLDEVRYRLGAELKQMELRLEQAYRDRETEEEATLEARSITEAVEKYAQETQARLDESLARLAAFSRSMSSLQDDRDRVLDEAKQWENRFHGTLQGKEAELREAESKAKNLSERLQREVTQKEELQNSLERLQKAEEQWQFQLDEAEKQHKEAHTALEKQRADLQQRLTEAESSLVRAQSELDSVKAEAEGLRHRANALEEAVGKLQAEANQARTTIKERETEERRLCLNLEQLETDLRSSKTLMDTLQTELAEKQRREMELLGEKEQAVTQAVEEARKEADGRAEEAERELDERRATMRDLEDKVRKAEEDASQSKARLDSFTKAMGSLQDDRDRVLSQYKQLEERHLQFMMEKDGLIQEAATENNGLKEELRALLAQRDDLHAENAKLDAQLHGYRDELSQVLSMKDSQHKKLLSVQLERISALEKEREEFTARIDILEKEASVRKGLSVEHETLSQAGQVKDAPGAEVEKLREQLQAAKKQIGGLEATLESERQSYAAHSKELKELRWEGGILRTETETAEERVAELARDLVEMEQKLLVEKEEAAQLRAQNQAFGQAMASLQNSHDEAVGEVKELRVQLEAKGQTGQLGAPASPSGTSGEVWSLKNALSALQNDRERMLEQLRSQRSELDRLGSGELSRPTQTIEEERRKMGEMEENMAKLLTERDDKLQRDQRELEMLRLECSDWQAQAESLKQQTLATLSDRDQQISHLSAMLEEAHASEPRLLKEHAHRQGRTAEDGAPGGPLGHTEDYKAECVLLQRRLDEEVEMKISMQEQLTEAQHQIERFTRDEWHSGLQRTHSETAVLIEPKEGAVTRSRTGGRGLGRMLRGAFCSRQRTPLLVSLYLLTVHVLLLLCFGGYL